jgi:hypothetical protein
MRWFTVRATFAAILVGAYLLIELAAKFYVAYGLGIHASNYESFYLADPDYRLMMWGESYKPHPYVGYVRVDELHQLEGFPEERDPHEYVIAILGGSVAEWFGNYVKDHPEYFEQLRSAIPAIGERRIRTVNFALGGYKQPQQFFLASYILQHADMMVNIDGFNEMAVADFYPAYPTDFPATTLRLFNRDHSVNISHLIARSLLFVYRILHGLPIKLSVLARSNLYFLIWQGVHPQLNSGIEALEQHYLKTIGADAALGQQPMQMASWQRKIKIWRKYTRLQHQVAQAAGVAAYFFLQPNQYLKGSKPLSEQERAIVIDPEIAEVRDAQMTLLRAAALEMRAERLPVFDLTQIYRSTDAPVYRDACCHLLELGNQIMGEQIIATIKQAAAANGR